MGGISEMKNYYSVDAFLDDSRYNEKICLVDPDGTKHKTDCNIWNNSEHPKGLQFSSWSIIDGTLYLYLIHNLVETQEV